MTRERIVEITPSAPALLESLRGLGYAPEAALADLIDNSLAAEATNIALDFQWSIDGPTVVILDDGRGMDEAALGAAMRLGGTGPSAARAESDLGRFGLGLKTASLSQCRRVTVICRQASHTNALSLDVDVVAARGWIAVVPEPLPTHSYVTDLLGRDHGTLVLWDRIDALSGLSGLSKEAFFLRLQQVRAHLGMVFHRFLDGDARRVSISMNGLPIKAWDPFLSQHPSVIRMPLERIRLGQATFTVKPYVLPHRDRFANDADFEAAGGPGGWNARQGFYVYRARRLLVAGSWLGLGGTRTWTREESSRLARIEIDLPIEMDRDWRIDVRKSQAQPPGSLRARLTGIAGRCREKAREIFAWRGQGPRTRSDGTALPQVWLASSGPAGTRYRVNREHPAIAAFLAQSGVDAKLFNAVLAVIERTVPVERIWLDVSETEGSIPPLVEAQEIQQLAAQLAELAAVLPAELSISDRVDLLLRSLPTQSDVLRSTLLERLEAAA